MIITIMSLTLFPVSHTSDGLFIHNIKNISKRCIITKVIIFKNIVKRIELQMHNVYQSPLNEFAKD